MKQRTLAAALALTCLATAAGAADKRMPIDFVGEWCTPSKDGDTSEYTLPSWTPDGKCTDILSIDKWGFSFDRQTCIPVTIKTRDTTASSGTAYYASISARCTKDGVNISDKGTPRMFEFERYKGRLTIKSK